MVEQAIVNRRMVVRFHRGVQACNFKRVAYDTTMFDRAANHKKYMKDVWYPKNHKKHVAYVSSYKKRRTNFMRLWLNGLKEKSGCLDCGIKNPIVLDFDHLRDKKYNVAKMLSHGFSEKKFLEEIAKCEVRCSNCHRIKTAERRKLRVSPVRSDAS